MNRETTRVTRGLVALGLGYFATVAVAWVVLRTASLPGSTELSVLGWLFLCSSVSAFFLVSAVESFAIERGFPMSRAVDVGYELATAGVLWTAGGYVGYGAMQSFYPGSRYTFPVTLLAGIVGVVVGELLLWKGRSGGDRSARA